MEEDLTPDEPKKEHEEIEIDTDNPIFVFCFMFMEYIKEINSELYDKAHKYAQDHTDIDITDFEIELDELQDADDEYEINDEDDLDYGEDDEFND
jgi:hypothetical protein